MFDLLTGWLSASSYPNALYVALLAVALLLLTALTATGRRIIRHQRERFDDLIAKYHTLRDNYAYLRDGGGSLALADPDAYEQATALREYAEQVRELGPEYGEPYEPALTIAAALDNLANELDPPEDEDDAGDELETEAAHLAPGGVQ